MDTLPRSRAPVTARVEAVLFDLDGTLIDSYEAIAECFNHARVSLGESPLTVAEVRTLVGHGLESLMEQAVGPARCDAAVRLFRERYDRICEQRTTALPGVGATLAHLRRRGLRMGVATNKPSRFAERILRALDLMPPIEVVIGPGDGLAPKPDPAMLLAALRRVTVEAARAVYVGDMEVDVDAARRAGLRVWLVPTGSRTREQLQAAGADAVLPSFEDLLRWLASP